MKVYIAGPMTGYVNFNREAFEAAEKHLTRRGFTVVNPAGLDSFLTTEEHDEWRHADYLRRDLPLLLDCDAIYFLPGSRYSAGAMLERKVSEGCGIFELVDPDLELWRTFEGEPEAKDIEEPPLHANAPCEVVPVFAGIDFTVDETLPPNVVRLHGANGHVDITLDDTDGIATDLDEFVAGWFAGGQKPHWLLRLLGRPA